VLRQRTLGRDPLHPRREPKLDGLVKRLDATRYDFLFVLAADGRRWFIPADRVSGGIGLRLGGPKYAEFEVERSEPIPQGTPPKTAYNRAP
jgi:hypothetical protein